MTISNTLTTAAVFFAATSAALISFGGGSASSTTTTIQDDDECEADVIDCILANPGVDDQHITAEVSYSGRQEGGGGEPVQGGSSYLADCNWQFAEAGSTETLHPVAGAWEVTFEEDHWLVWCAPFTIVYTFFPDAEGPPVRVLQDMIGDAYYRTPVVAFNPQLSPNGEDIPLVVQSKTFLWVDETLWDTPVSATAAIAPISVTTTARAYKAVWTGGDEPDALECSDHGAPYRFGIGGDDANDDTCSVVFTQDSIARPDQTINLAVHWDVTYTCSAYCSSGNLPDIITQSSRDVEVTEIQIVGAANPSG
jgi:hypothetical protein